MAMKLVFVEDTNWQQCPKCDSDQIEGDSITIEGKSAWQEVSCLHCNHQWVEAYAAQLRHWDEED